LVLTEGNEANEESRRAFDLLRFKHFGGAQFDVHDVIAGMGTKLLRKQI
jgi:hypothetical protein